MIRHATPDDAAAMAEIYNHYVVNTTVSFDEIPTTTLEMERKIRSAVRKFPWLALEENGTVEGYARLSTWKERASYRHTAEVSIYLRPGREGCGRGCALMERLLEETERYDMHVLTACIALPNPRSIGLHEKFGFHEVGRFHEVGFKMNQWIDVGYWELVLRPKNILSSG